MGGFSVSIRLLIQKRGDLARSERRIGNNSERERDVVYSMKDETRKKYARENIGQSLAEGDAEEFFRRIRFRSFADTSF